MTETVTPTSAGWRMKVAAFALAFSIFAVLWFMTAALGTKFGWWPYQFGLGKMVMQYGFPLAGAATFLGLVAQVIAVIKAPRTQPFILALAATLLAGLCLFRVVGFGSTALSLPPIHDVQTDWSDPIQFSEKILAARKGDGDTNPVLDAPKIPEGANARWPDMGNRLVSEVQEEAEAKPRGKGTVLPKMEPLYFSQSPLDIAKLAETLIKQRGWDLVSAAPNRDDGTEITIEATATSGWFGFKDDIAIRIRPVEGATRVDMRSISRVGLSDLGANSKRVSGLMYELQDRADGKPAP